MTGVLIVGDDPASAESLAFLLGGAGFETSVTAEGLRALVEFDRAGADVLLLDVVLPGMSGIEVLRRLRASSSVPVIMTTARDGELDKVLALELGADDYVTKPYSVSELIARISALLRRGAADGPVRGAVLVAGDLRMDVTHTVTIAGVDAALPLREFLLLECLLRNSGRMVTRERLIELLWGEHRPKTHRPLDQYMKRLRSAIGLAPSGRLLTVHDAGYILHV